MLTNAAKEEPRLTSTQVLVQRAGSIAGRKIWLPRLVYDALPWFYLLAGAAAFLATLYISEWFWVLPHYLLFAAGCVHLGIVVTGLRRRRRRSPPCDGRDLPGNA